jgi:hypothetical protein
MDKDNTIEFLRELTELSRKYKVEIWGCGCCNSPQIRVIENPEVGAYRAYREKYDLTWDENIQEAKLNG